LLLLLLLKQIFNLSSRTGKSEIPLTVTLQKAVA